jgi:hypothetical protein
MEISSESVDVVASFETIEQHVSYLVQRTIIGSVMMPSASGLSTAPPLCFEKRGEEHFEVPQGLARPRDVIALASNREIGALSPTVYVETSRLGYLTPPDGSQTQQLDTLKQGLEDLRRQLECFSAVVVRSNEGAEQAYALVQQQLLEGRQQIVDLEGQLGERQRRIADLQSQLGEGQQRIADLQSRLAASEAQANSECAVLGALK